MGDSAENTAAERISREVLSGSAPLATYVGVSPSELAGMAAFGHDLWRQGRPGDAAKIFLGLIALDEKTYYGHAGMGLVAMSKGDLDSAERHLKRALALEASDRVVAINLGEVLLRKGEIETAISVIRSAAGPDGAPNDSGAVRARAILAALGRGIDPRST